MCDQAQVPALASLLPRLSSGLPVLTTMPYYYLQLMIVSIGFASASEWPYHNWAQWAVRVRILSLYNGQLWHCRGQLSAKMFDVSEWRLGDEEICPAVWAETRGIAVFNSGESWGYYTALLHWNAPAVEEQQVFRCLPWDDAGDVLCSGGFEIKYLMTQQYFSCRKSQTNKILSLTFPLFDLNSFWHHYTVEAAYITLKPK